MAEPSAWAFGWEALVALGTLGLAAATAYLALQTRGEAKASRQALQTTIRPLIVDAPRGVFLRDNETIYADGPRRTQVDRAKIDAWASSGQEGRIAVSVPLHNVGSGVALIEDARLIFDGDYRWTRTALQTAVPPGQLTELSFGADIDVGDAAVWQATFESEVHEFSVEVAYTDLKGGQRTRTRVQVRGRSKWWRVTSRTLLAG